LLPHLVRVLLLLCLPPSSAPFPYTTLFRSKVWLWSRFAGFGDHNHTFAVGTACGGPHRPAHPSMHAEKWAASSSVASSGSTAETYWSGRTTTTAPEREISRVSKISSPGPAA